MEYAARLQCQRLKKIHSLPPPKRAPRAHTKTRAKRVFVSTAKANVPPPQLHSHIHSPEPAAQRPVSAACAARALHSAPPIISWPDCVTFIARACVTHNAPKTHHNRICMAAGVDVHSSV